MITRSFLCKQSVALQTILLPRLAPHLLDALRLAWALYQDWILQIYSQAHHGEVVVGFGTVAVGFHLGLERFDDLTGGIEMRIAQELQQAVVAELFLLRVLGFVESVGIDKQRTALDGVNLLTFVFQSGPQTDGRVGNHIEEFTVMFASANDGRIMAGIAEVEMTRREVNQSEPEGGPTSGTVAWLAP